MTDKTSESYGKNANRAQFQETVRRSQDTCDVFSPG